jgi:hypothetical protein
MSSGLTGSGGVVVQAVRAKAKLAAEMHFLRTFMDSLA